jgi:hypothetical protein
MGDDARAVGAHDLNIGTRQIISIVRLDHNHQET